MKNLVIICFLLFSIDSSFARKNVLTEEETKLLQMLEKQKVNLNSIKSSEDLKKVINKTPDKKQSGDSRQPVRNPIYVPAPVVAPAEQAGFVLERDSTKIQNVSISYKDALNIKMCYSAGVSIIFDDSFPEEIQRTIKDDDEYFHVEQMANFRGVFVKMKMPIQRGKFWESAVRLVTKSNDKTILINLIGVACPDSGGNPFPKVYYLKEKYALIDQNTNIMTPEDTIVEVTNGLPRLNKNVIKVYDMVFSSNSDWVVMGVEVQFKNPTSEQARILFKGLDNRQITPMRVKQEYLKNQSIKASQANGVPTLRFNLKVNLGKDYLLNKRYFYLITVDEESQHYQYMMIDLRDYFISLKRRGFNL